MANLVFVGGLQRSGTTTIGRLVAQHRQISPLFGTPTAEDEGQFVQTVYPDDHRMGREQAKGLGPAVHWAYHRDAHWTELDADRRPHAREKLLSEWSGFIEDPEADWILEKSPSNVMKTRFLQRVFPGAHFIVITRHPLVQALAVRKWGTLRMRVGLNLGDIVDHWLTAMETFRGDLPRLGHVHICSYEDLVANAKQVLADSWRFLDLQPSDVDVTWVRDGNVRYIEYWRQIRGEALGLDPLTTVTTPGSRMVRAAEVAVARTWGSAEIKRTVQIHGDRIRAFGYEPEDLSQRPAHWWG